jgi:Type I phosphodiesterase / nucleotide pyrophosphatase
MTDLGEVIAEKPRYQGESIVNLMASILEATGTRPAAYPRLADPCLDGLAAHRHVVLIVVDGLGYGLLRAAAGAKVMREHLARRLTSVFPPSTASAVTTFLTGLAPQQHGLTGWFMYLRELERVVTVLPFRTRADGEPLGHLGVDPRGLFGHTPVFDYIERDCYSVMPRDIAHSPFNIAHTGRAAIRPYRSLTGFFAALEQVLSEASRRSYVYAYWPELDHLAHLHGVASPAVGAHLAAFDAQFGAFLRRIAGRDAHVLLTADHGFVDIAPGAMIDVAEHPRLRAMLTLPLCGEPRTVYCHVRPSQRSEFAAYVGDALAEQALCVASEELIAGGYFGPGPAHPELESRVGDFALLMRPGYALLERRPGEAHPPPIGVHGGGSEAELGVPLVVVSP